MKRFIYTVTILLIILIGSVFQLFFESNKVNSDYNFISKENAIYINEAGHLHPFILNGVTLTATQPGVIPSGNEVTFDTYVEWFGLMQDMGLNTVKVDALMPGTFYEALRVYNEGKTNPLYLVQGVYFDEVALKDGYSPLDKDWRDEFQDDIEAAIDAVHGNANIFESIYLFKPDPVDVSEYILSYVIGINWGDNDVSYSNALYDLSPHRGDFFSSGPSANDFEIFLTEMLDFAANYEVTYYSQQSLYSIHAHGGRLAQSIINGDAVTEVYDTIRNYPVINAENILPGPDLKSGLYVNYDIEQVDYDLNKYGDTSENPVIYNGLDVLTNHHSLPIVISAYGLPTGRFVAEYNQTLDLAYIDENAQAMRTLEQYRRIRNSGVAGQFLRDWQDAWFKSSWYSYNLKILDHSVLWRDVQTYGQGYGIVAFDPAGKLVHYEDDSIAEWDKVADRVEAGGTSYKVESDATSLHFLLKNNEEITDDTTYYIGLDITPNSGSKYVSGLDLRFKHPVDFVVVLDMDGVKELLVQDYYDVNGFRLLEDYIRRYPDRYNYSPDSSVFNGINQYSDDNALYYRFKNLDEDDIKVTGNLVYGNNNPEAQNYLSSADWYKGTDYIELRLPYGLLNFMSPASKMIIDDFHKHHIFRPYKIDSINVEYAKEVNGNIRYSPDCSFKWDDWTTPKFDVRLKKVFNTLKVEMKGE